MRQAIRPSDGVELLLLAALWGGSFLFMRIAAPVLGPVWLIELRVLLAGLALLPMLIRFKLWSDLRRHAVPLFVVGCINSALPFLLLAFASVSLPAGLTSILNATAPLFGLFIAVAWLGEKSTLKRLLGFGFGLVGVMVLVGWRTVAITPVFLTAIAAGLLAALLYAIAAPYVKKHLADIPPLVIATGSQLSAALFLLPAVLFTVPHTIPQPNVILSVLALAICSTAFAYILYFRLIQNIGATATLTVTYLIPLFAIIWGAIVLHEPVTLSMLLGCSLVLLGTAIANNMFEFRSRHHSN
jgi:drug/metabolite transporter (DMT)-like permease